MEFEMSIVYNFTRVSNNFRYNLDLKMNELGLHGGQVFVLISLWKNDGQSQIDLATNLNLSAPSINKMVKSLMQSGFVDCQKCGNDNRVMRVHLTQKGIEQKKLVEEKFVEFEAEFFSNISETEKLILTQIFSKLNESFIKKKSANIS